MIFKTITDESTLSGQRIVGALQARKIAQQQATAQLETDIACLKQYEIACQSGSVSTEQFDNIMKKASVTAKEYTVNIKAGTGTAQSYAQAQKANNAALQSVGTGAGIASKAVKALSVTMNTIAITAFFTIVSKGISWITEQINDYIHRNEIAIEKAEELLDTFKSEVDTITSNQDKINGYADEFKELSKGVDDLGRNVSLTADEYSRYQSIVKEIVGINPSLISGYDEENNVLADKNGLIETSIQLLKDEYNQKLKNLALPDNVDTAINGAIGRYNSAKKEFTDIQVPISLQYSGVKIDEKGNRQSGFVHQIDKYIEDIIGVEFKGNLNQYILDNAEAVFNNLDKIKERAAQTKDGWEGLNDSQLIDLMDYFKELRIAYNDMNNATTSANPTLQYVAMAEDSYSELTDVQKKFIADYINGIQITSETTEQEKDNIRKSIISLTQELSNIDDIDVKNAFKNLYTIPTDGQTIKDYVEQFNGALEIIKSYCQENGIEIPLSISKKEKDINKLQEQYDSAVAKFGKDNQDTLEKFFKDNSINTSGEIDYWNKVTDGAKTASEAVEMYNKAKQNGNKTDILSFSDAWEQLKNSTEDATKGLADNLTELAEKGRLTAETFSQTDTSGYFENLGISADDAVKQINSLVDSATQLQSMSAQISKMSDMLADKKNGTTASASDFTGFDDTVKGMDSWEEYKTVMGDTNSTLEECQRVSNALATEWANSGEFLSQLTDETKDFYATQLSLMGVENAQEVVESRLAQKKADVAAAQDYKNFVEESGLDITNNLSEVIGGEITQLQKQGVITDNTANSLSRYVVKKAMVNGVTLDTNKDIQHLANLAGATTELGDLLIQLAKIKSQALNPSLGITPEMEEGMTKGIKERIQKYLNGDTDDYNIEIPDLSIDDNGADGYKNSSSSSEKSKQKFDWIETLLSRIERKIKNLGNTVSATWKSWSTRNDALAKELSSITDEINAQQKAYDTYMSYANGVGLSDYYKQLVQSGDYKIEEIGDDTLKEQIELYKEYYEKALDCADTVDTLQNNLADLAKTKFDNVGKQFDEQLQSITHSIDMTEATIDNIETKAYIVSGDYYNKLINLQKQNIAGLQEKYVGLQNAMNEAINSGNIAKYSEEWYELQDSVNSAEKAVIDADKALLEYENDLRQLNWDIFDKTEDYISKVQEESNFLIDLMSNSKLFNDTGKATDNGMASLGLHVVNLNAYMSQADDYSKEIQRISKDIADDLYNVTLIERRQELIKSQQDMIKNAEEEKQAIKSLISDGYNTMLDALNKLIDKRKEFLNAQKDAYDYQKNIQEQTKEIANYQKQLQALQGDMSEETRSKVQQIKVSLEEAQTKLQETEYDKWVSDTEQMLDMLSSETESWINERLDNLDGLITEVIDTTNANADNIQTTLQQVGEDVGYSLTPEMDKIWETNDGLNNVVTQYTNSFETHMTTVQDTLNGIKDLIQQMSGGSTNGAGSGVNGTNNAPSNGNTGATTTPNTSPTTSNPKTNNSGGDGKANVGDSVIFDNGVYHEDEYGNGRSGAYKLGQTVYITKINPNSQYPYHISQTNKLHEHDLGWVRLDQLRGYAKGSRYIKDDQLAFTQENGGEIIYRAKDGAILTPLNSGDMVFTAEMSNRLWEMAKGNMNVPSIASSVPKFVANTNNGVTTGDTNVSLTLNLPNVTNYNEFKQALLNDNSFSKAMADKTIGVSLGKNSLLYKTR